MIFKSATSAAAVAAAAVDLTSKISERARLAHHERTKCSIRAFPACEKSLSSSLFLNDLNTFTRAHTSSLRIGVPRSAGARERNGTKRFECLAWLAVANQLTTPGPVKHYSYCSRDSRATLYTLSIVHEGGYCGESAARERAHCSRTHAHTHAARACKHSHEHTYTRTQTRDRTCNRGSCISPEYVCLLRE